MAIRVAIGEDNLIVRQGVAQLLTSGGSGVELVAECGDYGSLVEAVDATRPDVVVTDIRMPPTHTDEGLRIAAIVGERHPEMGVVLLSSYPDPGYAMTMLELGTERRAYMLKDRVHDRAQLISAVHTVAAGGSLMDPKVVEQLVLGRTQGGRSPLADLTAREREVLAEVAQGKSNSAIAESLVLSKRAVENHINAIFAKLDLAFDEDVSKRVKAALLFRAEARGGA